MGLSNPSRHFGASTTDSIDFGTAGSALLFGLVGLSIRVVFNFDGAPGTFGGGENDRTFLSAYGATAAQQAIELCMGSADTFGTCRLNVSDGGGVNVATVASSGTPLKGLLWIYPSRQWHELVATWSASGVMGLFLDGLVIGSVTGQSAVASIGAAAAISSHLTFGAQSAGTYLAPGMNVREIGLYNAPLSLATILQMAGSNDRSRMYSPQTFIGSCEMQAPGAGPEYLISYGYGNTVPAANIQGTVTGTWCQSHDF
jgi:hypothetical protein